MLNYKEFDDQMLLGRLVSEPAAAELFQDYNSLEEIILKTYSKELQRYKGISKVKSEQIPAVAEIIRRVLKAKKKTTEIHSPIEVFNYFKEMQFLEQEEVRILLLNVQSEIMAEKIVSRGTVCNSLVTPREVFGPAVRSMAKAVVVVHNHPSGDSSPSSDDKSITKKIAEAAAILEIQLVDHIIIGRDEFVSLKEEMSW
jgi:DNA repair protein RadC